MKYLVILIIVCIIAAGLYFEKRRRDALAVTAKQLALSAPRGGQDLPQALDRAGFYLLTQGQARMLNAMHRQGDGHELTVFEYDYDAPFGAEGSREVPNGGSDGDIVQHGQTVAWVVSSTVTLPDFDLSPKGGPVRRPGRTATLRSVAIPGDPEFKARMSLAGSDPAALRHLFDAPLRGFLTANPDITVEGRGNQWLFYALDHRVDAGELADYLARVDRFFALLWRPR